MGTELTDTQFDKVRHLVKGLCGINLHAGKKQLVKARLNKRLRDLSMGSFDDYLERVHGDTTGTELTIMLDSLCTNLTRFFREPNHFQHLARSLTDRCKTGQAKEAGRVRIWSAGCSSGEEAYSIAITAAEALGSLEGWDVRILATDLSTRALASARQGIYTQRQIANVAPHLRGRYFDLIQTRPTKTYKIKDSLRKMVHFHRLNLMDTWPMRGPFDTIFCRNVMIYFDKPTQSELIQRFDSLLPPGAALLIGHSESLAGIRHKFKYVEPTIYQKL